jgi:hypothetical protein
MAKQVSRTGVHPRVEAAHAKRKALQDWSDGKKSKVELERITSKANEKLRGA